MTECKHPHTSRPENVLCYDFAKSVHEKLQSVGSVESTIDRYTSGARSESSEKGTKITPPVSAFSTNDMNIKEVEFVSGCWFVESGGSCYDAVSFAIDTKGPLLGDMACVASASRGSYDIRSKLTIDSFRINCNKPNEDVGVVIDKAQSYFIQESIKLLFL